MKHKLLKLNAVLLLGAALTPLQGQTTMNVKATGGTQTPYTLSTVRKLTFPSTGNMTVTKTTGVANNFTLSNVRSLMFGDATGIEAVAQTPQSLRLYPNPVVDMLTVELGAVENQFASVEILSIDGKVLYRERISDVNTHQIDVSNFQQGIYLCRVNDGTKIQTNKFFKK